jgi:hypothetical protein
MCNVPWHALEEVSGSAIMTPFLRARSTGKVVCNCFFHGAEKDFLSFRLTKKCGESYGAFWVSVMVFPFFPGSRP